jgi:hypothetical protein
LILMLMSQWQKANCCIYIRPIGFLST